MRVFSTKLPPRILRDADIRPAVFEYALSRPEVCKVIPELTIRGSKNRADVALVFPDRIECIEIKGHSDSLKQRWRYQADEYPTVFDRCWLVFTPNKRNEVLKPPGAETWHARNLRVPDFWGLLEVTVEGDDLVFEELRPASPHNKLQRWALAASLVKPELAAVAWEHARMTKKDTEPTRTTWETNAIRCIPDEVFRTAYRKALLGREWLLKRGLSFAVGAPEAVT